MLKCGNKKFFSNIFNVGNIYFGPFGETFFDKMLYSFLNNFKGMKYEKFAFVFYGCGCCVLLRLQ